MWCSTGNGSSSTAISVMGESPMIIQTSLTGPRVPAAASHRFEEDLSIGFADTHLIGDTAAVDEWKESCAPDLLMLGVGTVGDDADSPRIGPESTERLKDSGVRLDHLRVLGTILNLQLFDGVDQVQMAACSFEYAVAVGKTFVIGLDQHPGGLIAQPRRVANDRDQRS
jgi:hypothetical protein